MSTQIAPKPYVNPDGSTIAYAPRRPLAGEPEPLLRGEVAAVVDLVGDRAGITLSPEELARVGAGDTFDLSRLVDRARFDGLRSPRRPVAEPWAEPRMARSIDAVLNAAELDRSQPSVVTRLLEDAVSRGARAAVQSGHVFSLGDVEDGARGQVHFAGEHPGRVQAVLTRAGGESPLQVRFVDAGGEVHLRTLSAEQLEALVRSPARYDNRELQLDAQGRLFTQLSSGGYAVIPEGRSALAGMR